MADSAFARRQLEKQGWKEGDGLGKKRNGISKPIKVSLKVGKTGVGHDPGTEFKDHWWLRVFNDAASSITKTVVDEAAECKTPQNKLYKGFVKGSILSNGKEEKDSDCSSDEDEMESTSDPFRIPTLDDIHKYCGGATGHRAATLGIKMKGKLSRAAEQERLFNEKRMKTPETDFVLSANGDILEPLKKKKRKALEPTEHVVESEKGTLSVSLEGNMGDEGHGKKRKHHLKGSKNCDISDKIVDDCSISENIQDTGSDETLRRKKEKKKKRKAEEDQSVTNESPTEHEIPVKGRKKSKHSSKDDHCETAENIATVDMSEESRLKKKKKKKKHKD